MRKSRILIVVFMLLSVSCERKSDEKTVVSPSTIEPEVSMNPQLNEFAFQVREKMEKVDAASGKTDWNCRQSCLYISLNKHKT